MSKRKIIIGNWKMNPLSEKEAIKWLENIALSVPRVKNTEIVICAPYIYLAKLKKISKKVMIGAQDASWGDVGAFTGEVSPAMLYSLGVRHVILGHSERRSPPAGGGETDEMVNKKLKAALASGLVPILCVGETERDEDHGYFNIVRQQIEACLKGVSKLSMPKVIVAYEPVWAISSTPNRRDATAADSKEMAIFIRKILSGISTPEIAKDMRVIYGGSVTEKDAGEFLEHGGVDGALPGRASLDPQKFSLIIKICEALKK